MNRSDVIRYVPLLVAIVVVGITGAAIVDIATGDELQEQTEQAKAYCYQAYGDPTLANANVVGNHGGLHCAANDDDPHLHDVRPEALAAAHRANESGHVVNWAAVERYKSPDERADAEDLRFFGTGLALVVGMVLVVPVVRRWG